MIRSQIVDLLKSHKNYWLLCVAALAANLLFYIFFIAGEVGQITQLQKSYQTQRQDLKNLRQAQQRAQQFAANQKAKQTFLNTVANKITFPDRLQDLEALFRDHNLNPSGLSFKSEKVNGLPLVRFVSAIELAGNYADLKAVIGGIRQLPGLFNIERLTITKDRKAGTLVLKMSIAAYFAATRQ
jgi:Tfp pilus assembly protein PilO